MDSNNNTLFEYEQFLRKLASLKSSAIIFNKGESYAGRQIAIRFQQAEEIIRMYIGAPYSLMASCYLNELYYFLKRKDKRHAKIIFDSTKQIDSYTSDVLNKIVADCNNNTGNIQIKFINQEAKKKLSEQIGNGDYNIILFDSNQIRFEYDPVHCLSYSSFNQKKICRTLSELFDSIFKYN